MITKSLTPHDAALLALRALAYVAGDDDLGPRLLEITGLDPAELRARASDPVVLAEVIQFLCQHEPSLIEVADALEVKPERLAAAGQVLA